MVPQSHAASKDAPVGTGRVVVAVENNLKGSTCLRTEDLRRLFVFWERRQRNERGEKERTKNGKREKNKCRQTGVQGNERKINVSLGGKIKPPSHKRRTRWRLCPPTEGPKAVGAARMSPQTGSNATTPREKKPSVQIRKRGHQAKCRRSPFKPRTYIANCKLKKNRGKTWLRK